MDNDIPKISFHKPENKEFEFEVLTLGTLFSRNDKLSFSLDKPHRVEFYQVLFITEGYGEHYIDFKPYEYSKGSLIFVSIGQIHAFDLNNRSDGFLLLFTEDFLTKNMVHSDMFSFSRLYNYHLYPPYISPTKESVKTFSGLFNELQSEYLSTDSFAREEVLRTLLKLLLLKAERIKRTIAPKERNSDFVKKFGKFRQLLTVNYSINRNADFYASLMNISYKNLNRIIKSITGSTAKAFIDDFIVLEIKRNLAVSDVSVKELTYLMGFDEQTNFVKYFKKHTGISPSQFKNSMISVKD